MDPSKPGASSKASHVNNGRVNESQMDEMMQRRGSVNGERQGDMETKELDVTEGITGAERNTYHRGSADKHKFATLGYQRRTMQKVVTNINTLSKGSASGAKPRAALKQVLFSQGVSEKTAEQLHLDELKQHLETFTGPESLKWKEKSQEITLENSWTDIVQSHSTMSKMQRHQQEGLWEFVHTELTYINKLSIIQDFVSATLLHLNQHGFLPEVTPELLFSNLPSIIHAHQLFWQEVVFPMLQEVRRTGKPFDPMMLEPGCLQFQERFPVYHQYCWEEEENMNFKQRQIETNPHFNIFVQWIEDNPQCERMRFGDMQVKPHQRITKYPLLLKAVLQNTQEPHVQQALKGMISSVNSFLESINNYMQQMDDEYALSVSAQRVEGYEMEGFNEEIDKYVRDISQFDLTCPVRGVSSTVVRKLLLEENLKVRGRKDNKQEVVALLFSDVLLLTKVQKKGERLRVVRPPIALDVTHCNPLKDGYSILLVEVGELRSPTNALILITSTTESCSTWFSTIQQAKKTLETLREEESRRLKNLTAHQWEAKTEEIQTEQSNNHSGDKEELKVEFIKSPVLNGSPKAPPYRPPEEQVIESPTLTPQSSPRSNIEPKFGQKDDAARQQMVRELKQMNMQSRKDKDESQWQEEERVFETLIPNEQSMKPNHNLHSIPNLEHKTENSLRHNKNGPHILPPYGLPDVDYQTEEKNPVWYNLHPSVSRESSSEEKVTFSRRNSQFLSMRGTRRKSSGRFTDTGTSNNAFSKDLKSPGLQKRRPRSTNDSSSTNLSEKFLQDSKQTTSNSASYSESDFTVNKMRNSLPPGFRTTNNSQKVFKLSSLKPNQGMFGGQQPNIAPNAQNKKPNLKTQRTTSRPDTINDEQPRQWQHVKSNNYPPTQAENMPLSSLETVLKRAQVRERDKVRQKKDETPMVPNVKSGYSPYSLSTPAPSLPLRNGSKDSDLGGVDLMRHRAPSVSTRWKEQLVDGDENDKTSSLYFVNGENVDWPGWCFDDEEVMDHLNTREEEPPAAVHRFLPNFDLDYLSEQEEGEYSEV